jgi:hypothetical protein
MSHKIFLNNHFMYQKIYKDLFIFYIIYFYFILFFMQNKKKISQVKIDLYNFLIFT